MTTRRRRTRAAERAHGKSPVADNIYVVSHVRISEEKFSVLQLRELEREGDMQSELTKH